MLGPAGPAYVVVVPLTLLHQLEAVAHVELVGTTPLQGTHANHLAPRVGTLEDELEGCTTQPLRLEGGREVEVIEQELVVALAEDEHARHLAIVLDDECVCGTEGRQEAIAGASRVEPADSLKAGPHRRHPDVRERSGLAFKRCAKAHARHGWPRWLVRPNDMSGRARGTRIGLDNLERGLRRTEAA